MLFYFTYRPNLKSCPPCPASITIVYSGLGEAAVWTAQQTPTIEQTKTILIKTIHNVRFFMVINLGFIKIFYLLIKKIITTLL